MKKINEIRIINYVNYLLEWDLINQDIANGIVQRAKVINQNIIRNSKIRHKHDGVVDYDGYLELHPITREHKEVRAIKGHIEEVQQRKEL